MEPKIVDKSGNPIKLSSYQKNALYAKAKDLQRTISNGLCSRSETRDPSARNVDKMIRSEFKNSPKMEEYRKTMQAIGADPNDCSTERLRKN